MDSSQRGQDAHSSQISLHNEDSLYGSDSGRSTEVAGTVPPLYGSSFENNSCAAANDDIDNIDNDDDGSVDSFVESPGEHAEGSGGWCRCPQHDDSMLENRLDVDLLSPNGCRVVTDNAPKTRRSFALWAAGAVLFVASVTGGFFYGGLGFGRNSSGRLIGGGLGSSSGSISQRHGPVLVYSSDKEQQPGVVASIRSVLMHASGPVEFLYIGDTPLLGMADMPQVRFRKLSQVVKRYKLEEFTNPTYARSGKNSELNTEPANYVRFVVHELLPKQSKAMWIDADTIVQCDVVQLFKNTFNEGEETHSGDILNLPAVAAVPRTGYPIGLSGRGRRIYGDEEISFNAGVYLMQLDRWRAQQLTDKIREITLANRYQNWYYTGSQPPLALAVKTYFEHLPKSWNVKMKYVNVDDTGALRDEVCLMHWAGPNKPWNKGHEDKIHSEFWAVYGTPESDEAMAVASGDDGAKEDKVSKPSSNAEEENESPTDSKPSSNKAMDPIDEAPQGPALSARRLDA